ncbi:hypothetical protein I4U23_011726 [Adineta vaga]|nr:hypothetical protein I4U23_011726 [Adineta vaga]
MHNYNHTFVFCREMDKQAIETAANMVQKSDFGSSIGEHFDQSHTSTDGVVPVDDTIKTIQKEAAEACKVDIESSDHKH